MEPLKIIRIAIHALTDRLITLLSLLMTFGLSCWAMAYPTWERIAMAGFFCVVVFLPSLSREKAKIKGENNEV